MLLTLIAALMIAVLAVSPWRTDDGEWFEISLRLAALIGLLSTPLPVARTAQTARSDAPDDVVAHRVAFAAEGRRPAPRAVP